MGGLSADRYKPNDIWSTVDGVNWQREVENAIWVPRGMMSGQAVLNNTLFLIGGAVHQATYFRDVWKTVDGIHWVAATRFAEWEGKAFHAVATYDNKLWKVAGDNYITMTNEVWFSYDGATWIEQKYTFLPFTHAAAAVEFDNKLWLIGGLRYPGIPGGNTSNDVWVMDLTGHTE